MKIKDKIFFQRYCAALLSWVSFNATPSVHINHGSVQQHKLVLSGWQWFIRTPAGCARLPHRHNSFSSPNSSSFFPEFFFWVLWSEVWIFHVCLCSLNKTRSVRGVFLLKYLVTPPPSPIRFICWWRENGQAEGTEAIIKYVKVDRNNILREAQIHVSFKSISFFFLVEQQDSSRSNLETFRSGLGRSPELKILAHLHYSYRQFRSIMTYLLDQGLEDMIESIMEPINNYYHSSSSPRWILFQI